jgi:pilus assembly protein CpaE
VSTQFSILIVTPDENLRDEVHAALESLDGLRLVTHAAANMRQGVELARSRAPQLVLVEMTSDLRALTTFAEEVNLGSPNSTVAAVFRPDAFGGDVSESAILIEALRAGVKDFIRRPVSSHELDDLIRRVYSPTRESSPHPGRLIAFISNKGGVGKSTLAVNAACGLALRHPERVLLVDASLQLGVCASLLDLTRACSPWPAAPTTSWLWIRFRCSTGSSWRCLTCATALMLCWKASCRRCWVR